MREVLPFAAAAALNYALPVAIAEASRINAEASAAPSYRSFVRAHSAVAIVLAGLSSCAPDAMQTVLANARPGTPRQEPLPAATDVRDPLTYQAFQSRGLGQALPLGEVLSTWEFGADGHFLREKLDIHALRAISSGAVHPQYDSVRAPTLALVATVTRPGASPDLPAIQAA